MSRTVPPGYVRVARPGVTIFVQEPLADALVHATAQGSVYEWAKAHALRTLEGRLPVYVVQLPFDGPTVVVRHNHHGGLLAGLRRDVYFTKRIPFELVMSLVLANAGIPTAEVVALISYRVNAVMHRVDVMTRELPAGRDLGAALLDSSADASVRTDRWRAVTNLLRVLASRGVWHQDLNVKNIYLIEEPGAAPRAALLDVDRVQFHPPGALVARANASRLVRSMRKWVAARGAVISDAEFALVTSAAAGAAQA